MSSAFGSFGRVHASSRQFFLRFSRIRHPNRLVPQARDPVASRNCGTLKEGWHSSQDAPVSVRVMKPPLHTIVMCLSIFTLFGAPDIGKAGPFDDFFKSIRNSFARPAPKPRTPQPRRTGRKQSSEAPPSDAPDTSASQTSPSPTSPSPTPVTAPPNPNNVHVAKATAARKNRNSDLPYGIPVPGKQGLVTSPFSPDSGYIDVRSFSPGTEVKDPYTGKSFLTP